MRDNIYMVYGKSKKDKRFKPFDMKNNVFVINLINASMFFEIDLPKLEQEIKYMNDHNPDFIFEIRRKE